MNPNASSNASPDGSSGAESQRATSSRPITRSFIGAQGNALVASQWGDAPRCVLLLHGGGQTRHAWDKTARLIAAAGWRAIALDQRGHGESEWPQNSAYTFPDFAADAACVGGSIFNESGLAPVVVGASLGGIASLYSFSQAAGETEGEPVFSGLILVDIVPAMDPKGVEHIQGFMRARAQEGFTSVEEAAEAVALYLPHRPRPRSLDGLRKNLRQHADGRWRWHWDPRFLDGPRSVNADWHAVERELTRAAGNLAVPALLVRGGGSELVSQEAARAFIKLTPACEYADIAEARHMVAGDKNDVFATTILDFLARRFPG